jgi:hypothetical protein
MADVLLQACPSRVILAGVCHVCWRLLSFSLVPCVQPLLLLDYLTLPFCCAEGVSLAHLASAAQRWL